MKVLFLILVFFCSQAFSQVTAEVTGATSTQAVLQIRNATGPCRIDLRENTINGPLHPDVTNSIDSSRSDTLTWQNGTRIITLGHERADLALAAETTYHGIVSGCTDAPLPFTFVTRTPFIGANWSRPISFNPAKWNNADYPAIDWSPAGRQKSYIDPVSGLRMKIINTSGDFSWRYGPAPLARWAGGTDWTNPESAINGSASRVASTDKTNPLDLYVPTNGPFQAPWGDFRSIDNLGLVIYGSGNEGAGGEEDRKVDICIIFNPAKECAATPFRVTLPNGRNVKIPGGSASDPDGVYPAEFPNAMYAGWGGAVIRRDQWAISSILPGAVAGVLTIPAPDKSTHFPLTLDPGNLIAVTGSGCIPDDLCTISQVGHAGSLTVAGDFTGTKMPFTAYPWGIRVRKVTTGGSISVGFQHKISGTLPSATVAEGFKCHPVEVTSSDGIRGHACGIQGFSASYRYLYFISNDGSVKRAIGALSVPRSRIKDWPVQDQPHAAYDKAAAPGYSLTDGRVFYSAMPTTTGSWSIFRLTYNGDWNTEVDYSYKGGWGGNLPETNENFTWENILPASQGKDLSTQIAASFPEFPSDVYGGWNTPQFAGVSGSKAFFYKLSGGQDGGPCWVAAVDLDSSKVVSLFNTLDGTGIPEIQWGNCHSVSTAAWPPETLAVALRPLDVSSSSRLLAGPFDVKPNAVLRGGSWSSDTSLPWPINDSYDNQCPSDISDGDKEFGATGNQCVTLKLPGQPCNISPSPAERAKFPACSWNSAFTQPWKIVNASHFVDQGLRVAGDSEPFRALKITSLPDGELAVVAQRNASWDYCCAIGSRPGKGCVNGNARLQHAGDWTMRMYPGIKNSCGGSLFLVNFSDSTPRAFEITRTLGASHYAIGRNGNNLNYVSATLAKTDVSLQGLAAYPVTGTQVDFPSFAGAVASIGTIVQLYLSHSQTQVEEEIDKTWVLDGNAYNPSYGWSGGNTLNNALAPRTIAHVSGDVWKTGVIGAVDYKRRPLIGWAGSHMLKDVSGSRSNILTAPDYSFCHVLRPGECGTGSVGETFVKAPKVYPHGSCVSAMAWANVPCVLTYNPGAGGVRQFGITSASASGSASRFLTYGFAVPGVHNPFFGPAAHPSGKSMLVSSGQYLEGVRMVSMAFKLPAWRNDLVSRSDFGGLTVQVPERAGATHARIKFGYNTALECTERTEACLTDRIASPFVFEADSSKAPSPCAQGCPIEVPALSGRLLYFEAEWLSDGRVIATGERTAVVVP